MAGPSRVTTFQAFEVVDPKVGIPALRVVALDDQGILWVLETGRWRPLNARRPREHED